MLLVYFIKNIVFLYKIVLMDATLVFQYFPNLTDTQQLQFKKLAALYEDWNLKINVVSRKDIDELYLRHVLHSLAIAKFITFKPGAEILDVGTGGGFPGIPLAILFPEAQFTLVDSIGKKIKVVQEVITGLGLKNVVAKHQRVEEEQNQFDFVVSRAVAAMPTFMRWIKGRIKKESQHQIKNGVIYLKGGNLAEELQGYRTVQIHSITQYYKDPFFETKKVVYLPQKYKG